MKASKKMYGVVMRSVVFWVVVAVAVVAAIRTLSRSTWESFTGCVTPVREKLKNLFVYLKLRPDRSAAGVWDITDEACVRTLKDLLVPGTSDSVSHQFLKLQGLTGDHEQSRMMWLSGLSPQCVAVVRDLTERV